MAIICKLIVEVIDARKLQPKDGQGTSSPCAIIDFHGQRQKTKTVIKNLNPTWNEKLTFNLRKTSEVFDNMLELNVIHDKKFGPTSRNKYLGRMRLNTMQFINKGGDLIYYPLKKKYCYYIQGEIGLKIYFDDEVVPPPPTPNPPPSAAPKPPERTETTTVLSALHTEAGLPYAWVNDFCPSSHVEESYPVDPTDLSLASIFIAFQLWFLILCLIVF